MGNSDGIAFNFPPPAIPGIGTSGGVTMVLEDRSGNDDPAFLTKNIYALPRRRFQTARRSPPRFPPTCPLSRSSTPTSIAKRPTSSRST